MAAPAVQACAACFGRSDSQLAKGMNMGIFSLLAVIVCVLAGIASFGVYTVRRAAKIAEENSRLASQDPANTPSGSGEENSTFNTKN